ncbi:MAG: dCTP deaminase [Bacteroidales bacterium]|nr:dCTP deaminase [Bacteroidales bacterium]
MNETTIRENIEKPYQDIRKIIVRHDQAVLKSIQVSEWFDFLTQEKIRPETITIYNKEENESINTNGILVDHEIETLILQDELKIIPLMYFNQTNKADRVLNQIGTTSIDIRLGTSFQIFYPEQYGIIDFTQEEANHISSDSSKRINLDFMESITITPGQFLLSHSMEYIKLPDDICGNLEGRSSFARLGIEIHMTAGFVDPGFEGVITFEIHNAGPTTVRLYPGMRIGQIRFEKNSLPKETYSKRHTVKYKGLLEHDLSRQSKDFEVELIKQYKKREKEVELLKNKE